MESLSLSFKLAVDLQRLKFTEKPCFQLVHILDLHGSAPAKRNKKNVYNFNSAHHIQKTRLIVYTFIENSLREKRDLFRWKNSLGKPPE